MQLYQHFDCPICDIQTNVSYCVTIVYVMHRMIFYCIFFIMNDVKCASVSHQNIFFSNLCI